MKLTKQNIIDRFNYSDDIKKKIDRQLIFLYIAGSYAYGTNIKDSDIDIRGLFIADKNEIIGHRKIEQYHNETNDITIYEISKALNLIANQNPNMQEILWIDEKDIIFKTKEYDFIRKYRNQLLSSLVKFKYSGYAMSQLKRLKGHNKWLTQEQEGKFENKPEIIDYCRIIDYNGYTLKRQDVIKLWSRTSFLTRETNTIYKIWRVKNVEFNKNNCWFSDKNNFCFMNNKSKESKFLGLLFFAKQEFDNALKNYNNWVFWKKNRNIVRSNLEEKIGYDSKYAMHTIRLLRMGLEILQGKGVVIKRKDYKELLDIRNGKWSYEKLIKYVENFDKNILEKAYKNTKLQKSIDKDLVDNILINLYEKKWKTNL